VIQTYTQKLEREGWVRIEVGCEDGAGGGLVLEYNGTTDFGKMVFSAYPVPVATSYN
jgi:hypothetical protein